MRILFIYIDNSTAVGYSAGIGVLSAILKRDGHETRLLHVSDELGFPFDLELINGEIREYRPGLICFSATTNHWHSVTLVGRSIREEFATPVIVGGSHVSAVREAAMEEEWIDLVCCGEGDITLPEVVRRLEAAAPFDGVPNLIYRRNGGIVKEPYGQFVMDLDSLPFDDHDIFDYGRIIQTRAGWAEVIVTRGCPYPCSYCFNQPLFDRYRDDILRTTGRSIGKRDFVRRRSVDSTIAMLRGLKERYPNIKGFTFVDDIMATEGEWFNQFCRRYQEEIALPYACTSQPLLFSRSLAEMLKTSGCKVVKMGIESGNEEVRRRVLRRDMGNGHLKEVFAVAKEFGLKPQSFNMIGIPGETIEQMMDTVRLNAMMRPYIVWVSTFIPYPGTQLYRECREKGMIDDLKWDQVDSYRGESVLREECLPALAFRKFRVMFRWHLNENLGGNVGKVYGDAIGEFMSLPDEAWIGDEIEGRFMARDAELDRYLRGRDEGHYVNKKYINIFWGGEYNYDLS